MHQLRLNLFDDYSEDIFPYQHVYDYYDNYFFGYYESMNIYEPFYYFFQNRGYNPHTRRSRVVQMGRTHDSASVTTPKAYPVNFHQVDAYTYGDGILRFKYEFESSTGTYSDLAKCTIGEIVTYPETSPDLHYHWPNPPFHQSTPNPTIGDNPAKFGVLFDEHDPPANFVQPYRASAFTAVQYYRYKCSGVNHGNYVNVMGTYFHNKVC